MSVYRKVGERISAAEDVGLENGGGKERTDGAPRGEAILAQGLGGSWDTRLTKPCCRRVPFKLRVKQLSGCFVGT